MLRPEMAAVRLAVSFGLALGLLPILWGVVSRGTDGRRDRRREGHRGRKVGKIVGVCWQKSDFLGLIG